MRVVIEPGGRTADVSREASAKRSLALYLLLSNDRSIAGDVATSVIDQLLAADCRHPVWQQQIRYQMLLLMLLLLLLLFAVQQQKQVGVVHQSGRKPSDLAVGVAK